MHQEAGGLELGDLRLEVPDQRPGDNLYTDCVLALDPKTGKIKWYYQFTPNDPFDYDKYKV